MAFMDGNRILLDHGSGGTRTRQLIDEVFGTRFPTAENRPEVRTDSSLVGVSGIRVAFTTDSFVVQPRIFPGGDIGKLAVCGTVNDLAVSGATPLALSAAFIIEEGFPVEELEGIATSMGSAAEEARVSIVTGDTKVVHRGMADGLFITTSGIGSIEPDLQCIGTASSVRAGDVIIINGHVGDHGMAILAARNDLPFQTQVRSDCAPLGNLIKSVLAECGDAVTFMRDATRGGLGTVLCELAEMSGLGINVDERMIPVRNSVKSMCDLFGFDPLFIANEGKVVMIVRPDAAGKALSVMRRERYGTEAAEIGVVTDRHDGRLVTMKTSIGGRRILTIPAGDQLPRIC